MTVYDQYDTDCRHYPYRRITFTECSCGAFRCTRCQKWYGPELGAADDAPALCDHCWCALGIGDGVYEASS